MVKWASVGSYESCICDLILNDIKEASFKPVLKHSSRICQRMTGSNWSSAKTCSYQE